MKQIDRFMRVSALALIFSAASMCFAGGYSESIDLSESEWRVDSDCTEHDKVARCAISVRNDSHEENVLDYPTPPASASYESGVFLLTFGCGTACSATHVYKLGGQLGGPFPLVEVADSEREVLMSLGDSSVRFYRMFEASDKPLY